ncbi:MAG: HD domain-containing protein [Magnetococcales bacterium]|nr:HD domain-containing protein [Magnetococcales bacterium]
MSYTSSATFDLEELTFVLTDMLDMLDADNHQHGKRVAYLVSEIAVEMGWSPKTIQELVFGGLLHDFGISSSREFQQVVDAGLKRPEGFLPHCKAGWMALASFDPYCSLATLALYHHSPWSRMMADRFPDKERAILSNAIFLADRIDVLTAYYPKASILAHVEKIQGEIRPHAGGLFAPELVEAFMRASRKGSFWLCLDVPSELERILRSRVLEKESPLTFKQMRQFASLFAQVVDAKSPFTADHSHGVARLARGMGGWLGLDKTTIQWIEIAGLLHDIGKMRVPDEVLEKKGALTADERAIIQRHSFDSYQILSRIEPFEKVARWAGFHHEKPSGDGYPYRLEGEKLELEARLIAVADIFQALVQNRPYRRPLSKEKALDILQNMATVGHQDTELVNLLGRNLQESWELATTPTELAA